MPIQIDLSKLDTESVIILAQAVGNVTEIAVTEYNRWKDGHEVTVMSYKGPIVRKDFLTADTLAFLKKRQEDLISVLKTIHKELDSRKN
jgi:hypothetical protein